MMRQRSPRAATTEPVEEPALLPVAHQRPRLPRQRRDVIGLHLFVAQPARVEHRQVGDRTEPKAAIEMDVAIARFAIGIHSRYARYAPALRVAQSPSPFSGLWLAAPPPTRRCELVVVPDDDEWMARVGVLEIGVGAVGGVADAVIAQRHRFAARLGNPSSPVPSPYTPFSNS